ncbi:hypothetical protein OXYTRIMIC_692 [Oxytricha trifallax]|uniref:Uncharacterized protein n=1 Tax=Oxytricha trifallax TaxID=1172189 RepID=A0A073I041_9SPIT|nr:hypothetical protein OXYTRIMIC_692 [Oxytricha trifallax]
MRAYSRCFSLEIDGCDNIAQKKYRTLVLEKQFLNCQVNSARVKEHLSKKDYQPNQEELGGTQTKMGSIEKKNYDKAIFTQYI